jgi:hypothetical protein
MVVLHAGKTNLMFDITLQQVKIRMYYLLLQITFAFYNTFEIKLQ